MIGRTIGKYRVVEQLGRGGMGTVYKAIDETLGREVAIKVLNADIIEADAIERFRREALTLARLNHPRIAAIHELTRDGHDLLMVMELLTGETCERLIERVGAMPIPHAVKLCSQVLDALQYAHKAGVVHRDLKPANIIVTPNGDVKVMDFGIARVQGSEHLTTNGFMVGTPAYMPPEQVRGEEVDPRMDLYSITVVLYRMLTHKLPFQGDTAVAMIHSQLHNPPTPPRQFRADLPEWLDQALTRGLMKVPGDRFQSALDFRTALEAGLSGKGQTRRPVDLEETIGPTPTPPAMATPAAAPSGATASGATPSGATPAKALSAAMAAPRTDAMPAPLYNAPTPQASKTVTIKTPHLATAAVLVGAVALGALVIAVIAMRRGTPDTPDVPATQSAANNTAPGGNAAAGTLAPASSPADTPSPTTAPDPNAPFGVTPPATPTPPAGAAAAPGAVTPPAAPAKPAAAPGSTGASTPAGAVTSAEGAPRPAAGRRGAAPVPEVTAARGAAAPASTPAPAPAPVAAAPAAPEPPTEVIDDVRLLIVENGRSREVEAKLALTGSRLEVRAGWDGSVLRSIAYSSVSAATYVRGRRPRGEAGEGIHPVPDIGGGGLFGGSRHWLTVQTAAEFLILRLEDRNVIRVLTLVGQRTGREIRRDNR